MTVKNNNPSPAPCRVHELLPAMGALLSLSWLWLTLLNQNLLLLLLFVVVAVVAVVAVVVVVVVVVAASAAVVVDDDDVVAVVVVGAAAAPPCLLLLFLVKGLQNDRKTTNQKTRTFTSTRPHYTQARSHTPHSVKRESPAVD